jgi:cyclophilin family peptidyl-prolyl cis-trans isomerase
VATDKRERQRSNRQARIEAERKESTSENTKQRILLVGVVAVLLFGGLFLLSRAGGDDSGEAIDTPDLTLGTTTTTDSANAPSTTEPLVSAVSAPEPGGSITGETTCPEEDGSSERITSFENAPPTCIDDTKTYTAEVTTNLGTIVFELDATKAPAIVNNFVVLARYHYYDDAPFHRIIPGFVIQGGDAVGAQPGTGDPGYSVPDELPDEGEYEIGSVAMANSGPDTNGSQFFVITGEDGAALPPLYSLFGTVIEGLDVVTAIESIPTSPGDAPSEPAIIESVTITESGS